MNDFNIEFAHIYADQEFGEEQIKSISKLKTTIEKLRKKKKSFVTTILIDEYSPIVCTLNEENFLQKVTEQGVSPNFIAYESKLSDIAENIISFIPKNLLSTQKFKNKKSLLLVTKDRKIGLKDSFGRHTCSLLIAAWILVRFGLYEIPSIQKLSKNKQLPAKHLITILPKKYEETEQKVFDILEVTKYKNFLKKINYKFY